MKSLEVEGQRGDNRRERAGPDLDFKRRCRGGRAEQQGLLRERSASANASL